MTYNDTSGIEALIASGDYDSAMKTLNAELEKSTDATMLALRGDLNWKLGPRAQAISDYEAAVDLDPSSPAAQTLAIAREVMDFYNRDLYNP